jgi:hypothetical protein
VIISNRDSAEQNYCFRLRKVLLHYLSRWPIVTRLIFLSEIDSECGCWRQYGTNVWCCAPAVPTIHRAEPHINDIWSQEGLQESASCPLKHYPVNGVQKASRRSRAQSAVFMPCRLQSRGNSAIIVTGQPWSDFRYRYELSFSPPHPNLVSVPPACCWINLLKPSGNFTYHQV